MKLIIRYKEPVPEKMRHLYERAYQVTFGRCKISWRNFKVVRILDIEESNIEIREDD